MINTCNEGERSNEQRLIDTGQKWFSVLVDFGKDTVYGFRKKKKLRFGPHTMVTIHQRPDDMNDFYGEHKFD